MKIFCLKIVSVLADVFIIAENELKKKTAKTVNDLVIFHLNNMLAVSEKPPKGLLNTDISGRWRTQKLIFGRLLFWILCTAPPQRKVLVFAHRIDNQ